MSVETELEAIRTGAAIYPLTDRAFLRITGPDATRWLNGMVTNSIQSLQPGEGNYNFLLNAQGRIQGDCMVYREDGDVFRLASDGNQINTIEQLLNNFIIMDDVEAAKVYERIETLLVIGSMASQALRSIGMATPPPNRLALVDSTEGRIRVMTTAAPDHFELLLTPEQVGAVCKRLNLPRISTEALEAHRILTATPKYGVDIRNTETHKDLPQETAQTHALHFNKGCYLGQEIVERIRSRGQVHRTFTAFTLTGELPTLPAPIQATIAGQTRPAGELTSAMRIGDTVHALGYLRREFATHPLTYPGGTVTPKTTAL